MTEQPIDLGYRKVARSAYVAETGQLLDIFLGTCQRHDRPVRHEGQAPGVPDRPGRYSIPCPEGHLIEAERLVAVTTNVLCDGACMSARRSSCDCGCGGMNHGKSWGTTVTREAYETALLAYRAAKDKVEAKREQRREATVRRARRDYDSWAADHAELLTALEAHKPDPLGYPQPGSSDFLCDLARQALVHGKVLTDNQAGAAQRVMDREAARVAERAAVLAERAASAKPVPAGKAVKIAGEVIKIKVTDDGYMRDTWRYRATIKADGYAVQVTLPRALQDWVYNGHRLPAPGYDYGYNPDLDDVGRRWTQALRGTQISFTAGEVKRSDRDESFGFASRPTKVTFTPPEPEAAPETEREAS